MAKLVCLLCWLLSAFCFAQANTVIPVYSYHLKPPLIIDQENKQGLYFDFVDYLNDNSIDYQFQLVHIPRKRIDKMLDENKLDGVLLGVNPVWFKDKQETRYLWTPAIFTDRDEMVSLQETPLEFDSPEAISGKVFGGVRGFYYFGINEFIQNNKALRVDTVHEIDLLNMLLNKRIDSAVVSRSTFDYMVKLNDWQGKFYLSTKPHDVYERRVLVPKHNQHLYYYLLPLINQLSTDEQWQATIQQYK